MKLQLHTLLELSLKSDEVVEVLEYFDLSVVYDFDRLRENTADCYWASSHDAGFQLRFNERQVLDTIFLFVRRRGKYLPVDPSIAGVPFFTSFDEAKAALQGDGVPCEEGAQRGWVKGDFGNHTVHYEFNSDGALELVTLAVPRKS